jgi:hypothetical protein
MITKLALTLVFMFFLFSSTVIYASSIYPTTESTQSKKEQKIKKFIYSKFGQWIIKNALKKVQKNESKKGIVKNKSVNNTAIAPLFFASLILMGVGLILILTLVLYVPGIILLAGGVVLLLVNLF